MAKPIIDTGELSLLAAKDSNSIIQLSDPSFIKAPIAQVPFQNLTVSDLSYTLNKNINLKGAFGNSISDSKIEWTSFSGKTFTHGEQIIEPTGSDVSALSESIFAVVHDPALQFMAIVCIVTFTALLIISLWRYSKNKIQKL